jgi:hypothetical protein
MPMTPDDVNTFRALVDAILAIFASNSGGFVLAWLLIIGLCLVIWRLIVTYSGSIDARFLLLSKGMETCQKQHAECLHEKNELARALLDLVQGRPREAMARAETLLNVSRDTAERG